jgi:hypothetical protein
MPAFSFEKLSPPVRRETAVSSSSLPNLPKSSHPKSSRGIIVQMIDRLTEARLRRTERDDRSPRSSDTRTGGRRD